MKLDTRVRISLRLNMEIDAFFCKYVVSSSFQHNTFKSFEFFRFWSELEFVKLVKGKIDNPYDFIH